MSDFFLPWDDVWRLVDASLGVMGDNEVFQPRRIHLLIADREVTSGEWDQWAPFPWSLYDHMFWQEWHSGPLALPWPLCPKSAPDRLLLREELS